MNHILANTKLKAFANKRPLSLCAVVCVVCVLSAVYTGGIIKYGIVMSGITAMFFLIDKKFIALFICALNLFVFVKADVNYREAVVRQGLSMECSNLYQVVSYKDKSANRVQYELKSVNDISLSENVSASTDDKILLSVYDSDINLRPGDIYEITGKLSSPMPNTNPHTFNYRNYLLSRNILYTLSANTDDIKYTDNASLPFAYDIILSLRENYENKIPKYMTEKQAGLLKGIMFASDDIDESITENFSALGTSHVLAVSGLHVGIVYSVFMIILAKLKIKNKYVRRGFKLLATVFIFVYIALSGFSVSCIRAAFMVFLSTIAGELNLSKRYDTVNTLSIILILSALYNPFVILGASFILSYGAVLSIAFIYPAYNRLTEILRRKLKNKGVKFGKLHAVFSSINISLAVQTGMFLISLSMFGSISLLSPIYNVIIVPIMSFCLCLGIIGLIIPFLSCPILGICGYLLGFAIEISEILARVDVFRVSSYNVSAFVFVLYFTILIFISGYGDFRSKKTKMLSLAILFAALSISIVNYITFNSTVSFLDVGFGDCAVIRTRDNDCILIDGGGGFYGGDTAENIILPYLYGEGIRSIDSIFATHSDADHMGGIVGLIGKIPIDVIYANDDGGVLYDTLVEKAKENNIEVKSIYAGEKLEINGCKIDILHPSETGIYKSQNDSSIVMGINIAGVKFLFTGDMATQAEMEILERSKTFTLKYDILKSAHHGSKFKTDDFELRLYTDVCVISVGDNGYNLPNDEYINSLMEVGVNCIRTDEKGLVKIIINKDGTYDIMNYIGSWRDTL